MLFDGEKSSANPAANSFDLTHCAKPANSVELFPHPWVAVFAERAVVTVFAFLPPSPSFLGGNHNADELRAYPKVPSPPGRRLA